MTTRPTNSTTTNSTTTNSTTTNSTTTNSTKILPRALLVGKCLVRETGNATTISRFETHLRSGGWDVLTYDPDDLTYDLDLSNEKIQVAIGLHAYRSSRVLLACKTAGVPYVVMFGGTDVNEAVRDTYKIRIMTEVVRGAGHLVAMTSDAKNIVISTWPFLDPTSISIIPQAVQVHPSIDFDIGQYLQRLEEIHREEKERLSESCIISPKNGIKENGSSRSIENEKPSELNSRLRHNDDTDSEKEILPEEYQPFVLLVAGLRPVKDVLYVAEAWSKWRENGGRGRLVIIGPSLDAEYSLHVHREAIRLSGVRISPCLPPSDCQALICQASVLLNSSRSEGMTSTILEAMALGTPVLARDIPGNSALVTHKSTGLLFSTPESFISELEGIIKDTRRTEGIVKTARERVLNLHSMHKEQEEILRILRYIIKD